ncbi:MAG: primosomal protein N' [Dehalococcoidia bacterium]
MNFAEVAVNSPIPHRGTYTYAVPPALPVEPGHGVYVPFGPRVLQGVVVALSETSEIEDPRPILSLVEPRPLLTTARIELARWISDHYLSSLYAAVALMLPPGFERKPLTIIEPGPRWDAEEGSPQDQAITELVRERGRVQVEDLKRTLGLKRNAPVDALVRSGVLQRSYQLDRPRVSPRRETMVELAVDPGQAARLAAIPGDRKSRAAELLELLAEKGSLPLVEAQVAAGGLSNLNKLVSSGAARLVDSRLEPLISAGEARKRASEMRLTARGRERAAALQQLSEEPGAASYAALRQRSGVSRLTLEEMERDGLVRLSEVQVERDPLAGRVYGVAPQPVLSPEQTRVTETLRQALDASFPLLGKERASRSGGEVERSRALDNPPRPSDSRQFLLHGVTGSGKTEVYLDTLSAVIQRGRRGIVLVPEIALTPQTIRRFAERFPGRVAVLHSGLSAGELHDQWQGIAGGSYDVVVGARSALFAPQPDLGLIVLDEEHEWTYKQAEGDPRYDARPAALKLAELSGAMLIAGSATPRVESYWASQTGAVELLAMSQRVVSAGPGRPPEPSPLPLVEVVDLRDELRAGNRSIFSRQLQQGIRGALGEKQQVILFLNRRGSAGFLLCRNCGFVPRCPSCGIAFSYHSAEEKLVCHGCNRRRNLYPVCPSCKGPYLKPVGAGTQKVEEEAAALFPEARIMRWDRDVTRGKDAHERILTRFTNREADILVGTQMLAKGLDLPGVSLVGVLNADIGLNVPDFRAAERTFQLLTQVAGRSGRAGAGGNVIIQSYMPDHYAITAAAEHDYQTFFSAEIENRRRLRYPPFRELIRLTYAHTNERAALNEAMRVAEDLRTEVRRRGLPATEVVGPAPAFFARLRGRYRWDVLVKGSHPQDLLEGTSLGRMWSVDVDPVTTG